MRRPVSRGRAVARWAIRGATIALGLWGAVGPTAAARGEVPSTGPHTRAVSIVSDPPGATIWVKAGRYYTCTNRQTPADVDFRFYGAADIKEVRLTKFGYRRQNVRLRASQGPVGTKLEPVGDGFFGAFLQEPNSGDVSGEKMNARVKDAIERTMVRGPDPFRFLPFAFTSLYLGRAPQSAGRHLVLMVLIDGTTFPALRHVRLGSRTSPGERESKVARAMLDQGMAEIILRFRQAMAGFPEVKAILVECSYATNETALGTQITPNMMYTREWQYMPGRGIVNDVKVRLLANESTVVQDRRIVGILEVYTPFEKLPATGTPKISTEAIISGSSIRLEEGGGPRDPSP